MTARSYLYVPGHRPDRFAKAASSGADAIVLDLEDAVPVGAKDDARAAVRDGIGGLTGPEVWVRVNGGELLEEDVRAVVRPGLTGVSLPKASVSDLQRVDRALGDADLPVIALVETAAGVLDAPAIANAPRVARLAIGEADLSADLAISPSPDARELAPIRLQIVLASAAAGIEPPIAPVSTDFADLATLRTSTHALRRAGFTARACIHPAQVPIVNEVLTPTRDEVDAARRLVARFEETGGGASVDEEGRMVDEAVVRAARRILSRARAGDPPPFR